MEYFLYYKSNRWKIFHLLTMLALDKIESFIALLIRAANAGKSAMKWWAKLVEKMPDHSKTKASSKLIYIF